MCDEEAGKCESIMYYGAMATGKRIPETWTYSTRLDPDGDNIANALSKGMIYKVHGPDAQKDFTPAIETTLTVVKIFVIIGVISLAGAGPGAWFGTFGCKGEFLETYVGWVSQFVIFLIILINIFIVSSEMPGADHEATWTGYSIIGAFVTWLLVNIVAKVGDTWLFFDTPFWPTPMTYWGAVMLVGIFIMQVDDLRRYWLEAKNQSNRDLAERKINLYSNLEYAAATIFCLVTIWRFSIELFKEKNKLGSKFSFMKFLLGLNVTDKLYGVPDLVADGRCKKDVLKNLKKEVDQGINNSPWRKLRIKISKMLN